MVLSNIFVDKDFIEVNLKSLKAIGFINYYGTQCFGTRAHLVGKQILLNQWKPVTANNLTPYVLTFLSCCFSFFQAIDLISEEFQGQQKFRPKEHQLCSSMEKDVNDLVDASHVVSLPAYYFNPLILFTFHSCFSVSRFRFHCDESTSTLTKVSSGTLSFPNALQHSARRRS